jgi:hypothetical protein
MASRIVVHCLEGLPAESGGNDGADSRDLQEQAAAGGKAGIFGAQHSGSQDHRRRQTEGDREMNDRRVPVGKYFRHRRCAYLAIS